MVTRGGTGHGRYKMVFPGGLVIKNSPANAGEARDMG